MIVVSDTSCISNLLTIRHAHLLVELFGTVVVPPAVEGELRRYHEELPSFLRYTTPRDVARLSRLARELDLGEAEAICLACELKADRLLIDEKRGRAVALREGLAIVGVVGILVAAKHRGLIQSINGLILRLEAEGGFRLSPAVRASALRSMGEADLS
jgi:uncharacterized protein